MSKIFSYCFNLKTTGTPGKKVTLRSEPSKLAIFKPERLLASDGANPHNGQAVRCVRELRFPHVAELVIDAGIYLKPDGTTATILVNVGLEKGGVIEMDVTLPESGKFFAAIFGRGRE